MELLDRGACGGRYSGLVPVPIGDVELPNPTLPGELDVVEGIADDDGVSAAVSSDEDRCLREDGRLDVGEAAAEVGEAFCTGVEEVE